MDSIQRESMEKRRQETSLKTMYFNRFLLIRYVTAGFFFVNLYWFFSLAMSKSIWAFIPGVTLMVIIRAVYEQCVMYSEPIDDAKKTIFLYKIILTINILLIAILCTPFFSRLYPFLTDTSKSHKFILAIIMIGIILCGICLKRLQDVKNRTDKQFKYIQQFEKSIY